jgi:hypothetical protein
MVPAVGGAGRRITGGGGGRALGLPTGAGVEVGGEPTTTGGASASAVVTVRMGRWSRDGTPSGTSEEHYRMELPQPSSSWFPCGRRLHRS